ncbi:prenyltransferase/squalene oxidase repeat-containing protein [Mesobacillus zeae]|uniref:Squalene--hopene cyclase n=1 Tax=Mesobacillus zeae TaxID=1917180 RepID=A0A398BDD3_9BACI|nr:prenyltransferase/squalene oxidase repeat-containing protein [Mesobacillus zeae]RID85770.1 squalene--hopene cyclase [Mesobacillus zeae]
MTINTYQGIKWIIEILKKDQSPNGSWNYPFETGISTDAYMIILLRTLEINDEDLIRGLASRIINKQEKNGAWKLFYDEKDGNLTTTLEAYYGLLYSGYFKKEDPRLKAAKSFIIAHGGMEKVNVFTKIMLALTGQYKWPAFFPIPIEVILFPLSFPINFYQFSVFGRVNLAPILILADKKFRIKTKQCPNLSDLFLKRTGEEEWEINAEWRSVFSSMEVCVKSLIGLPAQLHSFAIDRVKKYMLERIESDGTFYSYYSSTFLMIFALLSLGYSKNDPLIINAINGLKSMKTEINGLPHMQYTTANVWNTSLINSALQLAEVPPDDPVVKKANRYLLERQHHKFGDWVIHNTDSLPGGWGFSDVNTFNPDVDDSTASLRSIARGILINPQNHMAWDRGINWLFSMQNDDGGWASFEKNVKNKWLGLLPIEKGKSMFADPSSADLTGRTLEFFGNYTNLPRNHLSVKKAVKWLLRYQETDGSWYGRWGICYLYGTWSAVTGLISVGLSTNHKTIQHAVTWLKSIQNRDGGWGESCLSDIQNKYVPLGISTLTDTSWALDALIAVEESPTKEIQRGITYLLESLQKEDWTTDYPKGQAMAGGFYVHYHSYRYIFPLQALSHYHRKYVK